jgi:hypothetical protein
MHKLGVRSWKLGVGARTFSVHDDLRVANLATRHSSLSTSSACVNPVDSSGISLCVNGVTLPHPLGAVVLHVYKAGVLCTAYVQVLQVAIHGIFTRFSSVIKKVLHPFHTTNNNKEILKPFYLLINRRIK